MQIKYQSSKKDFIQLNNWKFKKHLKEKPPIGLIIFSILFAYLITGKTSTWQQIIVAFILSMSICILMAYLVTFFRLLYVLWQSNLKSPNESYPDEKVLTISDEGLLCTYTYTGNNKLYNWNEIGSIHSTDTLIFILLVRKTVFVIPKFYFQSEEEAAAFISSVEERIPQKPAWAKAKNPPYWMGWLCLIPLIGGIIGIVLILNGIFKYRNIKLTIIGALGLIFTVAIYSFIYFYSNSDSGRKGFEPFAKSDLNNLMKNIEFYKVQHGGYPDSLTQLKTKDDLTSINDPLQAFGNRKNTNYNYKKVGNKYYLFSSGIDGIPNTKDDLYPDVNNIDTSKIGLIIKQHQ